MDDLWATVRALAGDRDSGAAEIAERAARILSGLTRRELPDALEELLRGHPSMGPLWRLATQMLVDRDSAAGAERFLAQLSADRDATPGLEELLPDQLLTLSYSSTVVAAIRQRRPSVVRCMTSTPGGEGERMAQAVSEWTQAELIEDDQAIRAIPAQAVVIGADAITPTVVLNKVRTRDLAEAAMSAGIPCYVVAGHMKFVAEELPIEPLLESAALDAFTAFATPSGVVEAPAARSVALRSQLHPALRLLIPRL
jgi:translation initiation factor 2B subunit (eIF-2B alpha/beta/delta family)